VNDYEQAVQRFQAAMDNWRQAKAALDAAEQECEQANANLAAHESAPGVPLPQYRPGYGLASCGHPADEDGECGCAYWPERAPLEV
jgi:hypothetical protein